MSDYALSISIARAKKIKAYLKLTVLTKQLCFAKNSYIIAYSDLIPSYWRQESYQTQTDRRRKKWMNREVVVFCFARLWTAFAKQSSTFCHSFTRCFKMIFMLGYVNLNFTSKLSMKMMTTKRVENRKLTSLSSQAWILT